MRLILFEHIKDSILNMVFSRFFFMIILVVGIGLGLIYRVFSLQIVNGQTYLDNFQLKIEKQRSIASTRGNIYDTDGNLLAFNELAYSVNIEDVYPSGTEKNEQLNNTINTVINMLEQNGDHIINDFDIVLDQHSKYQFNVEDTALLRFLADVYGHASVKDLEYKEKTATPEEVINYLCGRKKFAIGQYLDPEDTDSFIPGRGYSKERLLKILTVRYALNTKSFQKYIATTIAKNVNERSVAVIMENADSLPGISIAEDTIRKYNNSKYFSQIIGYTGKIDPDELKELQEVDESYDMNDIVGKSGIEASMETVLQGEKGYETVFVDNVGKVIETSDRTESTAGDNIYLTIKSDLQIAATDILEEKLASILLAKIRNIKEYTPGENSGSSDIVIPIYDVYYACLNNNIINIRHFDDIRASETEKAVKEAYDNRLEYVLNRLKTELYETHTPYEKLSKEYQVYESFIVSALYSNHVLKNEEIDKNDPTYVAWTTEETISLYDYLAYAIASDWVDVTKLEIESQYSDASEIYEKIVDYIEYMLADNVSFSKKIYKYMIKDDSITGRQICQILIDQNKVIVNEEELSRFEAGAESSYDFMVKRIESLDITPGMLALDPCSGSIVVTNVNTGEVLALITYPSYDNNQMVNGVDAEYYASLRENLASPLINYATYQKTAPGSTFKMVSSTAGLLEGVISTTDTIQCNGIFDKMDNPPKCWIYPRGSHGSLNVSGGIKNSCNVFFYEVGYRLSMIGETYNNDIGLNMLKKYADMYGLTEKTGVEIEEAEPEVSDLDAVRSAIGQGTNNFTTIGLSRYVTTVANSGTCYNLTLLDKATDSEGNMVEDYKASVRNIIQMDGSYWRAIHAGMRGVVESKAYYSTLGVNVAGKTGTAQESKSRPNHALFVSYAPYEDPEISVTVRVANGYTSDYAAQIAREVYKYYFKLVDANDIITGNANGIEQGTINGD